MIPFSLVWSLLGAAFVVFVTWPVGCLIPVAFALAWALDVYCPADPRPCTQCQTLTRSACTKCSDPFCSTSCADQDLAHLQRCTLFYALNPQADFVRFLAHEYD